MPENSLLARWVLALLLESLVSRNGQEGQTPELHDITFRGTASGRRWQSAQVDVIKVAVRVGPTPDFRTKMIRVGFNRVPQSVVRRLDVVVDAGVCTEGGFRSRRAAR